MFQIRRGTNISHWLSQSGRRGQERRQYFTRHDITRLSEIGLDHVRIPVDEEQLWDERGRKQEETFELLDAALGWCAEFGLKAIVDLHILRSHHFNQQANPLWVDSLAQKNFLDCWRDLSTHLNKWPSDAVAYEILNEPVAANPEDWNVLVSRAVGTIQKLEPKRYVVIGSNRWQSPDTFDSLRIPEGNIILSFHFYTPFLLTHYKADWTKTGQYSGQVMYPGITVAEKLLENLPADLANEMRYHNNWFDEHRLENILEKPIRIAKQNNKQLYCGEWGCLSTVPRDMRLRWYSDVKNIFEKNKIAWTNWDYKGSFGIFDQAGNPDRELIRLLLH